MQPQSDTKQMRWCGPRSQYSRDETALVVPHPVTTGKVLAQFDNRELPEAYGWHEFPASFFTACEAS